MKDRAVLRRHLLVLVLLIAAQTAIIAHPALADHGGCHDTYAFFMFGRFAPDPTNSALFYGDYSCDYTYWRAGSGNGSTDECAWSAGWLPGGWYEHWGNWDDYSGDINGRVYWVQDHQCWNGNWRTELFIHTEQTWYNGQNCYGGDSPECWEGANDYYSLACIKIAYPNNGFGDDIGDAHWHWHWWFGLPDHGQYTVPGQLYVFTQ